LFYTKKAARRASPGKARVAVFGFPSHLLSVVAMAVGATEGGLPLVEHRDVPGTMWPKAVAAYHWQPDAWLHS